MKRENAAFDPAMAVTLYGMYMDERKKDSRNAVLDIFALDGSFASDNAEELIRELTTGEKLNVKEDADNLSVCMESGAFAGFIPFRKTPLLRELMRSGKDVFCVVEYSGILNGTLTIYVTVYCARY